MAHTRYAGPGAATAPGVPNGWGRGWPLTLAGGGRVSRGIQNLNGSGQGGAVMPVTCGRYGLATSQGPLQVETERKPITTRVFDQCGRKIRCFMRPLIRCNEPLINADSLRVKYFLWFRVFLDAARVQFAC